jgi:hypothetical protein
VANKNGNERVNLEVHWESFFLTPRWLKNLAPKTHTWLLQFWRLMFKHAYSGMLGLFKK